MDTILLKIRVVEFNVIRKRKQNHHGLGIYSYAIVILRKDTICQYVGLGYRIMYRSNWLRPVMQYKHNSIVNYITRLNR